jgi:oxygen-dependent protoporphyrinogen oxidase
LCQALGLADQLIATNQAQRKLYLLHNSHLAELPAGMNLMVPTRWGPVLRSPLLSVWGKLRLGLEMFLPARPASDDESMADFVRHRFGREVLDRIASPLLAGVYAGDPNKLSIQATFRRFPDMEQAHGSLIRAARHASGLSSPQPAWTPFVSLRGGMGQLIEALCLRLDPSSLRLNTTVVTLTPGRTDEGGYTLTLDQGELLTADAVVLAVPAFVAADLVAGFDAPLATQLRQQRYISSATVALGFPRQAVAHPLDGFGFVVPSREGRSITACTWSSTKFPGRAPHEHVLLRCFIGRDGAEALLDVDDTGLVDMARHELRSILGITSPPLISRVTRWPRGMPQYDVGHHGWLRRVEATVQQYPHLLLTGHAYHGIGLPDIIQRARLVALALWDCKT